jgi:hypothetical protein
MDYWNRYQNFLINGEQTVVPFVTIPAKSTDKRYVFREGTSRMDKISQQFYNSPYFGWLILAANPKYGGLENSIPDGSLLFIPFPLISSLQDYKSAVDSHILYYGR